MHWNNLDGYILLGVNEKDCRKLADIMEKALGYGGTVIVSQYSKNVTKSYPTEIKVADDELD